jgi:hypothetical protein
MYQKDSDYALNKRSENIVFSSADGPTIEITPADCPDFDRWKAFSDEDYHAQELHDQRTTRKDVPLDEDAIGSADEPFEDSFSPHTTNEAMAILEQCLTETQRRRYLLHVCDGLTIRRIASQELVDAMAIQHSIAAAEKKIKFFLQNPEKRVYKTPQK